MTNKINPKEARVEFSFKREVFFIVAGGIVGAIVMAIPFTLPFTGAAVKRDKSYQPNPVNVKAGGTVTWTNNDSVTSGFGSNDLNYGKQFDSGLLVKGQSFAHTFKTAAGRFNYFCVLHPLMVGQVIIK
jgi:hypothetical protein